MNEEEHPVPVGTWTSQDENTGDGDGVVHLPGAEARRQPSAADRSNSQVGPLPTSPLALARGPVSRPRRDATGKRPKQEAQVVALRPELERPELELEPELEPPELEATSSQPAPALELAPDPSDAEPLELRGDVEADIDDSVEPGLLAEAPLESTPALDSEPGAEPSTVESELGLEPEPGLAAELAAVLEPEANDEPGPEVEATAEIVEAKPAPKKPEAPVQPPMLASAILRDDLFPTEPFSRGGRLALALLGAASAAAAVGVGGLASASMAAAVCGVVVVAAALMPLSYGRRATIALTAAVLASSPFVVERLGAGHPEDLVLGAGTVILGAGLMLRGWYRSSRLARVVVALGVVAVVSWFVLSGGLVSLTSLESGWQSWLPTVVHILIVLVALLSLLVFMDASTTAGASFWATSALALFAAHSGLGVLASFFPLGPRSAGASFPDAALGAQAGGSMAMIAATVALGLLLAVASRRPVSAG